MVHLFLKNQVSLFYSIGLGSRRGNSPRSIRVSGLKVEIVSLRRGPRLPSGGMREGEYEGEREWKHGNSTFFGRRSHQR